ncbi:MAG: hypothetical protein F6K26_41175 [Moorea sp. SIO2I5]|nr:hypothetical protein [Moorena sp. SIO2I5]
MVDGFGGVWGKARSHYFANTVLPPQDRARWLLQLGKIRAKILLYFHLPINVYNSDAKRNDLRGVKFQNCQSIR